MNVIFELIRNGIRLARLKVESFSRDNLEDFTRVIYDECSGFHIVEEFNIAESESFLIVSKECLTQNCEFKCCSFNSSECIGEIKSVENQTNLDPNCKDLLKQPKFCDFKSTQVNAHESGSALACIIPTKMSIMDINRNRKDDFLINSIYEDTNEPYFLKGLIHSRQKQFELTNFVDTPNLFLENCVTPRFPDSKYRQNLKSDEICFTPDGFDCHFDDDKRLKDDFKKSDIFLLLRLKRKKLAVLENQLKRDVKLLNINGPSENESKIDNLSSIEKMMRCPAQLYFIKRRIENIKENIENTERDIAMLEEKTSETC
ncbi:Uncharacterized protein cmbei_8002750 [Cryptosporidium meleagridis]